MATGSADSRATSERERGGRDIRETADHDEEAKEKVRE
jgi:hypothetical protein